MIDIEHADRIPTDLFGGNFKSSATYSPSSAVSDESLSLPIVEIGRAQHISSTTRNVSRLWIVWGSRLILPCSVLLGNQP